MEKNLRRNITLHDEAYARARFTGYSQVLPPQTMLK
jgi:hypothetical protein